MPELILSAEAMKGATDILSSALPKDTQKGRGKVVIGTTKGTIRFSSGSGMGLPYLRAFGGIRGKQRVG